MSDVLEADACIVGAGAGGAVLGAELAEGGMSVVVLEQGQAHDPDSFTARPPEMLARLYRDAGQTVTLAFNATTSYSSATSAFFVDDVAVSAS